MLGVGLRKLCPQDSFGYAFRDQKIVRNSKPRRVQNRSAEGPTWPVKASETISLYKWDQFGRQGRPEAVRGRLWERSWDAFGALGAVLGPSGPLLGRPGPLLGASWGSLWDFQGLIWKIWTMSVALREMQQKPCFL